MGLWQDDWPAQNEKVKGIQSWKSLRDPPKGDVGKFQMVDIDLHVQFFLMRIRAFHNPIHVMLRVNVQPFVEII